MKQEITYDLLLEKIPNKYILTLTTGKRMREIIKGKPLLVKTNKKDPLMKKVFKELVEGKITYAYEKDEKVED
ncbi:MULTISPECIES: DNA-directed RNA polymerase subunit omega [Fusobacterium]|uniref:DNA-directed RNA polymerase subunit omega n=1 Tax=Fusobacterium TaxID=848 RepID=UPI0004883D2D|nr:MULTISPECIES: DNA-directed RNA polymerase subunit omega [Fusobacterium]MCI6152976.1 DNA-directed RNA polymerase subunit omega [Fusobacterium perfoetens]MDY3237373.1 DNA-directed RNA polymerase subunit omega [Fusobacterium perfoetens]NME35956.1 DNA-directed RNA polymerase subunit omega [Fusobacterium sp. FSA-380-WT-3A]